MRRPFLFFVSVVLLAVAVSGCGPGPAPADVATATSAPPTEAAEPTEAPEQEQQEEGGEEEALPTETAEPTEAPEQEEEKPMPEEPAASFELTSPAFAPEEAIPQQYSCDGEDISPPLEWTDPPEGTQSFALIVDDPDAPAGIWVHWVLYNLPGEARGLAEGVPPDAELPDGSRHGENSWGRTDYGGPCPPSGTHRYFFKLYALDTVLDLDAGASKETLLETMEGHILAQAETMGVYSRQ
jgi:Raf kinase inhibitor-like YbhB/YbcL family protein